MSSYVFPLSSGGGLPVSSDGGCPLSACGRTVGPLYGMISGGPE